VLVGLPIASGPVEVAVPLFAITIAVLGYVRWVERKPLVSIGVRWPCASDLAYAIAGFVVGMAFIVGLDRVFEAMGLHAAGANVASRPLSVSTSLLILATNPVSEEVLFRGYAIERLSSTFVRTAIAAPLSIAAFLTLHIPFWGILGAIEFLPWTILITALYVWRRNLPACILMHVLGDAMGLVVIPWLG
jgi:membrane protease YdiL (CAAX protease family)